MNNSFHHQLVKKLDKQASVEAVWKTGVEAFKQQGIEYLIYLYCRSYQSTEPDVVMLSTMPDAWNYQYHSKKQSQVDPYLSICCQSYHPMKTGAEYVDDYKYLTKDQVSFVKQASRDSGFTAGVSFVMRRKGTGPDYGGWNIGTSLDRKAFDQLYDQNLHNWRLTAMYIHERLLTVYDQDKQERLSYQSIELTQRQVDCLTLLAQGKRVQQIADTLSIKVVTVDHHISEAKKRLSATTREQAIARAMLKGILPLSR